ncbi:MAG: cupredoxin domain-containing protein [Euzebyales bacterium]|nr:cupredoxin domain-containing protein [Euzebyales bacterium]
MVLARFPIPPLAVYVVLVAGGLALRRRKPTAGLLVVGISTLLIFAMNAVGLIDNLGPLPRTLWAVAVVTVALALAGSSVARLTVDAVTAQPGDVDLTIARTAIPPQITATAGDVTVFVSNADPYSHTFTIDELGVDQTVVAGQEARVGFSAQPGEYRYRCAIPGHEFMEGTLLVK